MTYQIQTKRMIIESFIRVICYGLLMVVLNLLMSMDASQSGVEIKFMEDTFTEWTQQLILLIMFALFAHCAYHFAQLRGLSILLAGVSITGLIREYNNFFNERVFDGAWQILALLALISTGFLVWRQRKQFWKHFDSFYLSLSFGIMLAGFATTFVFSRLFGKTAFWEALMEDRYFRSVKNAAEESIELLGYGLLLIAAFEFYLLVKSLSTKDQPLSGS